MPSATAWATRAWRSSLCPSSASSAAILASSSAAPGVGRCLTLGALRAVCPMCSRSIPVARTITLQRARREQRLRSGDESIVPAELRESGGHTVRGGGMEPVALVDLQHPESGVAEMHRLFKYRVEQRRQIVGRGVDAARISPVAASRARLVVLCCPLG